MRRFLTSMARAPSAMQSLPEAVDWARVGLPGRSTRTSARAEQPASTPAVDPNRDEEIGTCPVCGETLRLGYAALVPAHDQPAPLAPSS